MEQVFGYIIALGASVMMPIIFTIIGMALTNVNKRALTEMHLISNEFENSESKRGLPINTDQTVSIMINEEDHLRIQCIMSGFAIEECYNLADKIDDYLDKELHFAFHEKYGYLTQCPTNVGMDMASGEYIAFADPDDYVEHSMYGRLMEEICTHDADVVARCV